VISVQQETPDNYFCHFSILNVRAFCILGIFSKTEKTWVSHRVKMMTRWPWRERWPKWPIDRVTQWPSSMSGGCVAVYVVSWKVHAGLFGGTPAHVRSRPQCSDTIRPAEPNWRRLTSACVFLRLFLVVFLTRNTGWFAGEVANCWSTRTAVALGQCSVDYNCTRSHEIFTDWS